jgi:hypothetical protein
MVGKSISGKESKESKYSSIASWLAVSPLRQRTPFLFPASSHGILPIPPKIAKTGGHMQVDCNPHVNVEASNPYSTRSFADAAL